MIGFLTPSPTLTPQETGRGQRLMLWSTVMAGAMFSLGGGFMDA